MSLAFKIMAFSILINIATGAIFATFPLLADPMYKGYTNGMTYNSTYGNQFTSEMESKIQIGGTTASTANNVIFNVLNMVNLGFVYNFLTYVTDYTHGFIKFMDNIMYKMLNDPNTGTTNSAYSFWFGSGSFSGLGAAYWLCSFLYIIGAITLFTGRDFFKLGG